MKITLIDKLFVVVVLALCGLTAIADETKIGFVQHIDAPLPLSFTLTDDDGSALSLEQLMNNRPAILLFNYYRCANVCGVMIDKTFSALRRANLQPGEDADVLLVSIDPHETAALAAAKKAAFAQRYGQHFVDGAHFLTGDENTLSQLQRSTGFHARYDFTQKQYLHPTGLIFLTAKGRISSYEFGLPTADGLARHLSIAARDGTQRFADTIVSICQHLVSLTDQRSQRILHSLRNGIVAMLCIGVVGVVVVRKRRNTR